MSEKSKRRLAALAPSRLSVPSGIVRAKPPVAAKRRPLIMLGDYVAVERKRLEETSAAGIVLPGTAVNTNQEAIVVSVGPGRRMRDGSREVLDIHVGDHVILPQYCGTELTDEYTGILIVRATEVIGVMS